MPAIQPLVYRVVAGDTTGLEDIASGIGAELATLASGVEGHAQLLCESLRDPVCATSRAERLWTAVRRMRFFSEKILSSSGSRPLRTGPTEIHALLGSIRQELEDHSCGALRVRLSLADSLPRASADAAALRKALLFLVETLQAVERDADLLVLRASNLDDDERQRIEIELRAVVDSETPERPLTPTRELHLGFVAARNLIHAQGATLAFEHCPGLACTARIRLAPSAEPGAEPPAVPEQQQLPRSHPYGGILILQEDPSLRALIVEELSKTGRRICPCPDAASARALLDATPERFELIIAEGCAPDDPGLRLASDALARSDSVKALVLSRDPARLGPAEPLPLHCAVLHKPFGIVELRTAVAQLLGTSIQADAV